MLHFYPIKITISLLNIPRGGVKIRVMGQGAWPVTTSSPGRAGWVRLAKSSHGLGIGGHPVRAYFARASTHLGPSYLSDSYHGGPSIRERVRGFRCAYQSRSGSNPKFRTA